jgi:toxin YhaV
MIVINGWGILAHPLFLDQIEKLAAAVERERERNPVTYKDGNNAKLLKALSVLAFETIPQDPTRKIYRQGRTLGDDLKNWFRAKFSNGRFRLFFRFNNARRLIIYAWVNDADTKRTYGSSSDAYAVFKKMVENGNPPNGWAQLEAAASCSTAVGRLSRAKVVSGDKKMTSRPVQG